MTVIVFNPVRIGGVLGAISLTLTVIITYLLGLLTNIKDIINDNDNQQQNCAHSKQE